MSSGIEFTINMGTYTARAHSFALADDLYLFFKFVSPESDAEIGVAYDILVDGGEWYINEGTLGGQDYECIDEIVFDKLPSTPEFTDFDIAVDRARRKFNGA